MLDRLVDLLLEFFDLFYFVEIVEDYQRGVVLRFGRFQREVGPGFRLYWPFHVERVMVASVVPEAKKLDEQTFTLKDGASVTIRPVVTYRVHNLKKHLLEVEDAESSLVDAVAGVLRRTLSAHEWAELVDPDRCAELEEAAASAIRREAFRWGVEVLRVQFPDMVKLEGVYRLYLGHRSNIEVPR